MKSGSSAQNLLLSEDGILSGLDNNGRPVNISLDTETAARLRAAKIFWKVARPDDGMPASGIGMPDGSIYSGISPEIGRPFFMAAENTPKLMNWDEANEYANNRTIHGHSDWELPTISELDCLARTGRIWNEFLKKARMAPEDGGFLAGEYWTADTTRLGGARHYDVYSKSHMLSSRSNQFSVLCVRRMGKIS